MANIIDGPAAGKHFMLKRAPKLLRVVLNRRTQQWDALDLLDDTPSSDEDIYVYRLVGEAHNIHLLCRGRGSRGRSGFYAMGDYELLADQPSDADVRSTDRWRQWATAYQLPEETPCAK